MQLTAPLPSPHTPLPDGGEPLLTLWPRETEGVEAAVAKSPIGAMDTSRLRADTGTVLRLLAVTAVVVVLLAPVSASSAAPALAAAATASQGSVGARGITRMHDLELQLLAAVNDLRATQRLSALRLNSRLTVAASRHSLSMAENGFFEHNSLNGSPFWKRVEAVYPSQRGRLWSAGENMAWGSPGLSARRTIELWLASPAHRENLLSPAWREIGLGAVHAYDAPGVYDGRTATILTADFGVRR